MTLEAMRARRASGDALCATNGWSVGYSTVGPKAVLFCCTRSAPGSPLWIARERDARDGETFESTEAAQLYALNAGRLIWFGDWKAARAAEGARS